MYTHVSNSLYFSMTSSPTPPPHKIQSRLLIEQANSHGPYLWGGTDIENALRWFSHRPTLLEDNTTTEPSSNAAQSIPPSVEEEGNDFLRLLLQSRGIWNPRPPKKRGKSSSNNNNSAKNHEKSKRRKKQRLNGETTNRNNNDGKTTRSETKNNKPLQSVLSGYYQLVHQSTQASSSESCLGNDADNGNSNDNNSSETNTADNNEALTVEASTNLYNDLATIISSRQHTHEIYQAALHHASIESENTHDSCTPLSSSSQQQHQQQGRCNNSYEMTIKIDEYMVHPITCTRRVYASTLYDRLLSLAPTHNDNNNDDEDNIASNKAVQKFLQKLFGLAAVSTTNGKIREVILLMVLEPRRRMQVRQIMTGLIEKKRSSEGSGEIMIPPQDDQGVASSSSSMQQEHSMELFPLLTSQRLSSSVSNNKNQSTELNNDKENESSSSSCPLITLLIKSILRNNDSNKWWTQPPSELLCVISQYHFPIASSYLHYWIDRAIDTHASLYQDTQEEEEEEETTSFHKALERIRQFHQTSHRLRSLVSHVIHTKGEEISASSSFHSGLNDDDDDEREEEEKLFCRSLALTAIKNVL